jgi:adenylylsulfate kinase-like enzyme
MIYWLTGQPGSGKTTIAKGIMKRYDFTEWFHIDGDDIRELFDNKDYSKDGRMKNIQLAQQLSQYLHSKGKKVLVSLVSPYKEQRDGFKRKMGSDLLEIYIYTSEIRGRESFFVQDYEPPTENYIDICTDNITIEECIDKIMDLKL